MAHRMPQAFDRLTTFRFHRAIILCLLPVVASATAQHGWGVLLNSVLAVATAWGAEQGLRRLRHLTAPQDLGAPLWGLLLSLLLPVQAPVYLPILGSLFAIGVVRGLLAGGSTPWINPVLASWAFLQAGWGSLFAASAPFSSLARSSLDERATEWLNTNVFSWISIQLPSGYMDLILGIGRPADSLVIESGSLVLLIATVYLLAKGSLPWSVTATFFAAFALPMILSGADTLLQVFSGTLLINLFFLSTDPSSRPLGRWSLMVYGASAGFLAFLVRSWGAGPDSVGYAVLLINLVVPWIDMRFRRKALNDFRLAW